MRILLAIVLVSALPEPYSELNLDQEQARKVEAIVQRYERDKFRLTQRGSGVKDSLKKEIAKNIESLDRRKDAEVDKLLRPDQKERFAEIRKLQREGVPIGNGYFRSYYLTPHYPPLPNRFMSLDEAWKEEVLRRERQDGVSFSMVNRTGKHVGRAHFVATLLDSNGRKIESHDLTVDEIDADGAKQVTILTRSPFKKLEIRLSE